MSTAFAIFLYLLGHVVAAVLNYIGFMLSMVVLGIALTIIAGCVYLPVWLFRKLVAASRPRGMGEYRSLRR
jgi:hypothetical protein